MPTSSRKKNRSPIVLVLVCFVVLFLIFIIYRKRTTPPPAIVDVQIHETEQTKGETGEAKLSQQNNTEDSTEVVNTAETVQEETQTMQGKRDECEDVSGKISLFLARLSEQEYIKAYEIHESLSDYVNTIIIKLLNNPPVNVSESEDLLSILKNAAHFYRVLGSKDTSFIKDILIYEGDGIENILAEFYQWSLISDECPNSQIQFSMPLKKLYEYACFFLNTPGGQSYLFRRESRTRILMRYYSLLILNHADQKGLNKYGFSVDRDLQPIIDEMREAHFLVNKDSYMQQLIEIQNRQKF
jgi:hypothetical protein